jgi:hypothetical protein
MTTELAYRVAFGNAMRKGGVLMSGRMKALIAALAVLGLAVVNGSAPWGP